MTRKSDRSHYRSGSRHRVSYSHRRGRGRGVTVRGGHHPDKSVRIHLGGLYLGIECELQSSKIPDHLRKLSDCVDESWPNVSKPLDFVDMTVFDVAMAETPMDHVETVRTWAQRIWQARSDTHSTIIELADTYLTVDGE